MKELSIFIDESGDFGVVDSKSPYYLVTIILHDQDKEITDMLEHLDTALNTKGLNNAFIHAGPLIRREREYASMSIDERRILFYKMRDFFLHVPIQHYTIKVHKKNMETVFELNQQLTKQMKEMILSNLPYFQSFDKIIVYYDNGQQELNLIINTILNIQLNNVEFRKATQDKYRLLQLADFICTLELLNIKFKEKQLSKSEKSFFYKPQELKKSFLKLLNKKKIDTP